MPRQHLPRRARLVDIAHRAGCSHAAVSCVLTGSGEGSIRVGSEKAQLIRQIAAELNFRPNHAARQLKGKRNLTLGIISRNWRTSFHLRTFYWLQQAAASRGYHILTAQCKSAAEVIASAEDFLSRGIDGAMCFALDAEMPDREGGEALSRLPRLVSLFGRLQLPGTAFVDVDEAHGIRLAVKHLHQRGRKRIALLLADEGPAMAQRRKGFLAAHRRMGRPVQPEQIQAGTADWAWEQPDV